MNKNYERKIAKQFVSENFRKIGKKITTVYFISRFWSYMIYIGNDCIINVLNSALNAHFPHNFFSGAIEKKSK